MKWVHIIMFASPTLELLLFLCTAALSRGEDNNEHVGRYPRALLDNSPGQLNATTMPNHLPEDTFRASTSSVLLSTPGTTARESRTTGKNTNQSVAPATHLANGTVQTVEPSIKHKEVTPNTTASAGIGYIGTTRPMYTPDASPNFTEKTTVQTVTADILNSWTTVPPVITTDKERLVQFVSCIYRATSRGKPRSDRPPSTSETGNLTSRVTVPLTVPECNCSAEGSVDTEECDPSTGQCVCVSGYAGLLCEECEVGFFTNGTTGCLPCACDSFGAVGPLCDSSGVCGCKTGVYGDKCDECNPGFFRFSSTGCQPCQCNNHTSYCHPQSGICVNCQGNTKGPGCQECKFNFYRRPGAPPSEACTPCPCSSVTSSGSCTLDSGGRPVCDECKPEYHGPHCEQCRDGFYNADSICLPCNCSGNAEPRTSPRLCHPETGRCLSCINNSTGAHCEHCAPGYAGDALRRTCRLIVLPTPESRTTPNTMTPSPNLTAPPSSPSPTTQSLLTSLSGPANGTTPTAPDVSWTQFNVIVLAVIIVVVVALMGVAGGIYTYREYRNRKLNAPFWTIELKEDNISFSSYHDSIPNADVSGLLEDEVSEVASNGQLALSSPANMYKA